MTCRLLGVSEDKARLDGGLLLAAAIQWQGNVEFNTFQNRGTHSQKASYPNGLAPCLMPSPAQPYTMPLLSSPAPIESLAVPPMLGNLDLSHPKICSPCGLRSNGPAQSLGDSGSLLASGSESTRSWTCGSRKAWVPSVLLLSQDHLNGGQTTYRGCSGGTRGHCECHPCSRQGW